LNSGALESTREEAKKSGASKTCIIWHGHNVQAGVRRLKLQLRMNLGEALGFV